MTYFLELRQTKDESKGNPNLGPSKSVEGQEHCRQVYEAILFLGEKATTKKIEEFIRSQIKEQNKQIEEYIRRKYELERSKRYFDETLKKSLKHAIKIRQIQRCIKKDMRIIKKGRYYEIDQKARFETRYQDPMKFGSIIFDDVVVKKPFQLNEIYMSELIKKFGAIIIFIFIEASRPLEDKFMTIRDRNDLVEYWAKRAIPLDQMFSTFWTVFNLLLGKKFRMSDIKPTDWKREYDFKFLKSKPKNEMPESQINECLKMLEKSCPDIYEELAKHKKSLS
jgi:hypothetical protein